MARRGHCCRCNGCTIVDIFRGEQRPTPWLWDNADPLANPPTGLPAVSDGLPFAKRRTILRPWLFGQHLNPRGGAMTLDLGASGIAVQGFALPFSQNPNVTRVGTYVTYSQGGGSFSADELNPNLFCSLCGESVVGSFALRIAPLTLMGPTDYISLYYGGLSFVELARCIDQPGHVLNSSPPPTSQIDAAPSVIAARAALQQAIANKATLSEEQADALIAAAQAGVAAAIAQFIASNRIYGQGWQTVPGGPILTFFEWQLGEYGNALPALTPYVQVAVRQQGYAGYYRSAVAARDETRWAARPAISLGSQTRLIQPTPYSPGHVAYFQGGPSSSGPVGCYQQVNDFFPEDLTGASGLEFDSEGNAKVYRYATEHVAPSWGGFDTVAKDTPVGTQTLSRPGTYTDGDGNAMAVVPTAQFTVHSIPAGGKYGASAKFTLPENADGLLYQDGVFELPVTFNRPIAGLRKAMFTVTGRTSTGATITQDFALDATGQGSSFDANNVGSGTNFVLRLVTGSDATPPWQPGNTAWTVIFDPVGPSKEESLGVPAGDPENPEPCVLKSRCSWLVKQGFIPGLPSSANTISSAVELRTARDGNTIAATASVVASSALFDVGNNLPLDSSVSGLALIWPSALLVFGRSRNPLTGISGAAYRAAIYRDGELIATPTRSRPAMASNWVGPFAALTAEDGSYLIQYDANVGLLQGFLSFVIDRTPPMGAWQQVNDFFIGDPTNAAGVPFDADGWAEVSRSETESSGWASGKTYFFKNAAAGNYTLDKPGDYYDDVGNRMPGPPTAGYQIHALPQQQRYGAQATIALPENVVDGQPSLVYDAPVPTVTITFNRPVVGLLRSMISVVGTKQDGSTVSPGFTISDSQGEFGQPGNTRAGEGEVFTVTLDQESQVHNSSWLVVLSPSGLTVKQTPGSTSQPEPCVLKARRAWLIAQDKAPGRTLIDTASSAGGLNRVPSLTTTISASAADDPGSTIDVSADITIPDSAGTFRTGQSAAIVPQVPETLDAGSDLPFSYFGLSTTIFPSAARSFDANCSSPAVPQKHSSLIVGGSEMHSLTIQVSGVNTLTQPLTFTSSLAGESCSQNCWVHQSSGGGASGGSNDTRTKSEGNAAIGRYSSGQLQFQGGGQGGVAVASQWTSASGIAAAASAKGQSWQFDSAAGIATASRAAATYPSLQTTTLGQLIIKVAVNVATRTTSYGDFGQNYGTVTSAPQVWFCHQEGRPKSFQLGDILAVPELAALYNTMTGWPPNDRTDKDGNQTAGYAAAIAAYNTARDAYIADYNHVGTIARPWPPTPVILTQDENGNLTGDGGGASSVGVLLAPNDPSLVAGYYVTDKNQNWVGASVALNFINQPTAFNISVRGQVSPETAITTMVAGQYVNFPNGVSYGSLGYSPYHLVTPFEDYAGNMISGGFFETWPNKRGASIVSATLTLTRSQEESLAAGQPVQVQDGSRTWTLQAS